MRNTLIAIAGPPRAGKTARARRLVRPGCARVVTSATRPARPGEIHDRDYRFRSALAFVALRLGGRLLAHARFGDRTYGVERSALDEAWVHPDIAVAVVTPAAYRRGATVGHDGPLHVCAPAGRTRRGPPGGRA